MVLNLMSILCTYVGIRCSSVFVCSLFGTFHAACVPTSPCMHHSLGIDVMPTHSPKSPPKSDARLAVLFVSVLFFFFLLYWFVLQLLVCGMK